MISEIRKELPIDYDRIRQVTELAFRGKAYAGGDEQDVIDRLRVADALVLSYVAISQEDVIGHIAFSPVIADDESSPWFALGPISVLPECQRQGIGSALIYRGLAELTEKGALGCLLMGDPAYYRRFGFRLSPEYTPSGELEEYFMVNWFTPFRPDGRFRFHGAFYGAI